jgi:hypothetical protein
MVTRAQRYNWPRTWMTTWPHMTFSKYQSSTNDNLKISDQSRRAKSYYLHWWRARVQWKSKDAHNINITMTRNLFSTTTSSLRESNNTGISLPAEKETPADAAVKRHPIDRFLMCLRKHLIPTQEELARDLTAVGYGMAFSFPPL